MVPVAVSPTATRPGVEASLGRSVAPSETLVCAPWPWSVSDSAATAAGSAGGGLTASGGVTSRTDSV